MTSIDYSDGRQVDYRRDANGNILGETDSSVGDFELYTASYDALDRVDTLTDHHSALSFDYDYAININGGNLQQLGISGAITALQTYGYDGPGRLRSIDDGEGGNVSWTLSAAGRIQSLTLPNGDSYSYTYDAEGKGRLTSISGPDIAISYSYDAAGNVISRTIDGRTETYSYDAVNRLIAVDAPGSADDESFAYDQAGNRIDSNAEAWTYNERNELIAQGTAVTSSYDKNGNLTGNYQNGTLQERFVWNAADQLVLYENFATAISAEYAYDSSGRRLRKIVWSGGVSEVTKFAWEGPRVVAELKGSGDPIRRFVYRGFTPLMLIDYTSGAAVPYFYVTDSLGTPHRLVDGSGAVVWSATYKAFGEATTTGTVAQPLRFPGQYYDAESGLHYNYKRYYQPGTGRYVGVDPRLAGLAYAYAKNSPQVYVDPKGDVGVVGAGIAVAFEVLTYAIENDGDVSFLGTPKFWKDAIIAAAAGAVGANTAKIIASFGAVSKSAKMLQICTEFVTDASIDILSQMLKDGEASLAHASIDALLAQAIGAPLGKLTKQVDSASDPLILEAKRTGRLAKARLSTAKKRKVISRARDEVRNSATTIAERQLVHETRGGVIGGQAGSFLADRLFRILDEEQ